MLKFVLLAILSIQESNVSSILAAASLPSKSVSAKQQKLSSFFQETVAHPHMGGRGLFILSEHIFKGEEFL